MTTRTLERDAHRKPDWRLEELEVGDVLFVPDEVRPFGKVYAYAKTRSYALGVHLVVERTPGGTRIERTQGRLAVADRCGVERPGVPGTPCDWGVIARTIGQQRWRWPFEAMEVGDEFRVASEDLPANTVRARAHTAGWKRGMHFAVSDSPITAPGYTVVRRVIEPKVQHDVAAYGTVRERVACFEVDDPALAKDWPFDKRAALDALGWIELERLGASLSVKARKVVEPPRTSYIFEVPGKDGAAGRFALDLCEDRIVIERVEMDMTHARWEEVKAQRVDEVLS